MAEQAMVTADGGAMNSVIYKLTHLVAANKSLPMELRSKIVNLKEDLECMHAFLLSLSEKQDQEERVRSWMVEAREMSYHIEDIFDGELTKPVLKVPNIQSIIERSTNLFAPVENRRPITSGIEVLFMSPYWEFIYGLEYSPSDSASTAAEVPSEPVKLLGIDAVRDELVDLLKNIDGQSGRKVISIVGCRGLGKKALAKEVHQNLKNEFDCTAFVEMTPNCGMNEILRKILSQISQQEPDGTVPKLATTIRKFLEKKRYFIAVCDVHSASSWRIIKEALPDNKRASRIMTTTCINSIANTCCPHAGDFIYEMKPLTCTVSKSLFPLWDSSSEALEVYNDILKMSGYTPLAVISLATILDTKEPTRRLWKEIRNSICFKPGNFQELEERVKIFSHSYYDLPTNLKACALYLSMLPASHNINRDWLVRKWIAEGFVHEEMGLCPEDVAKNYFSVLVNRNFIQPVSCSNILLVDRYQVDFMMLCLLKEISQKEKFVTLLNALDIQNSHSEVNQPDDSVKVGKVDLGHVRSINVFGGAVSIDFQEKFVASGYSQLEKLISTLLHAPDIQNSHSKVKHRLSIYYPNPADSGKADKVDISNGQSANVILSTMNVRVLDLEGFIGISNDDMKHICSMHLLKYLGLKQTHVSKIPQEIRNLKHLETLDVRKTNVRELPKEVGFLTKLVNLLVGDSDIHQGLELPEGSKDWKLLNVLSTIDLREHASNILLELIGNLPELRELEIVLSYDGITIKEQNDDLLSLLRKCRTLQSLVVFGDFSCSMPLANLEDCSTHLPLLQKLRVTRRFVKIPSWIANLVYLSQLDIRVCKLEENDLIVLRELPSLQKLILGLEILPKSQPIIICNAGFLSLDTFCFDCKIPCLSFQQGAMPNLKHLELKFYYGLATQISIGTKHLITLKKVVLWYPQGCKGSAGIIKTVDTLKQEAEEHVNYIRMYINDIKESFPWNLDAESSPWKSRADKGKQKIDE